MNKQVLGASVTSVIILAATLVPSLANASSLFDFFCAMTRAGAASGPQQNSCLLQQGQQLLNQYQQNQGINQNPCPSGTQLVGVSCQVINGLNSAATTAAQQICQTQNTVLNPIQAIATSPFSVSVSPGTSVTADGSSSIPSTVSTGFGTAATCTTTTGNIVSYQWIATGPASVNLNGATQQRVSFIAPQTGNITSVIQLTLTVTDSNGQTSTPSAQSVVSITVK